MYASSRHRTTTGCDLIRVPASLADIFTGIPDHLLPAGDPLVWPGDEAGAVFQVRAGTLRQVQMLRDGRRSIVRFLFPGDLYGFSAGPVHMQALEAITPVSVAVCSNARLQRQIEACPSLQRQVVDALAAELEEAFAHLVLLGRMTSEERVATFLLEMARRQRVLGQDHADISLVMSRLDIADHLGVTLETVCRVLATFREHGLVEKQDRRCLRLLRVAAMTRISGTERDPTMRPHPHEEGAANRRRTIHEDEQGTTP